MGSPLKPSKRGSLPQSLRAALAHGRPAEVILDQWPDLEASARHEPDDLAAAIADAARMAPADGLAALAPAAAVAAAVLGPSGQRIVSDRAFDVWFDRPFETLDMRRLMKLAARTGRASGLAPGRDGAANAVSVGRRDAADGWPLTEACRTALAAGPGRLVVLAFAPSRASDLVLRAADAFGLTPLEARLAEALLDSPTLQAAAERIGVGRETARDALRGAMKKTGARRSPDLVRRMMDLICGDQPPAPDMQVALQEAFGATPAEARAAERFADGLTAREVAASLGVKEATVRGQLKAVFAKTGVNKAKDLVRLCAETSALETLTHTAESVLTPEDGAGRLRIVRAADDRRVAFVDYGPRSGHPLIVFHGASTGRTLPPRFVAGAQARGWRPIVPQRPGFGLTDRADGDHMATAADDLALVLGTLRQPKADLLARDFSAAACLAFAERHPERVGRGALINPHAPSDVERRYSNLHTAVWRTFLARPELIEAFAEMLRRQSRTDILQATMRRSMTLASDRSAIEDPRVVEHLARDSQALSARTSAGFAAEQSAYVKGWRPPTAAGGEAWRVLHVEALSTPDVLEAWRVLPRVTFSTDEAAGFLIYFTHPEVALDLLGAASR